MVKLVAITQGANELINKSAQEIISYVARVSNPNNQLNFDSAPKLLKYLIEHKHFSPFEHAYLTLEITTSRAIAAQILRHRSFTFQEYSQRYAESGNFVRYEARRQDVKNRQNSIDDLSDDTKAWFKNIQDQLWETSYNFYKQALKQGVAKECARFLLPLNTETTVLMTGNVRSWVHYIELRTDKSTQLEHRTIAESCKTIISEQFPDVSQALGWNNV